MKSFSKHFNRPATFCRLAQESFIGDPPSDKGQIFYLLQILKNFLHLKLYLSDYTLNDLAAISPRPKTNATALILWIQTCLFYIVAAMAEYALLLTSRVWIPYIENKKYFGQLLKSTLDRLDKCMVILFPIVFFIHSFVFWKSVEGYY